MDYKITFQKLILHKNRYFDYMRISNLSGSYLDDILLDICDRARRYNRLLLI